MDHTFPLFDPTQNGVFKIPYLQYNFIWNQYVPENFSMSKNFPVYCKNMSTKNRSSMFKNSLGHPCFVMFQHLSLFAARASPQRLCSMGRVMPEFYQEDPHQRSQCLTSPGTSPRHRQVGSLSSKNHPRTDSIGGWKLSSRKNRGNYVWLRNDESTRLRDNNLSTLSAKERICFYMFRR